LIAPDIKKMNQINLFNIIPDDFFKPLAGKYKAVYTDCLSLIYNAYRNELSFGVDKEIILGELENYFEGFLNTQDSFADEEDEIESAKDAKARANAVLRRLKECGWLEYETSSDYRVRVNLNDYAVHLIESFNKIIKNEEMEYQSLVSQIHATLINKESYIKPYEYIIKRVTENTEELNSGLKKLNTNIKKHIDALTADKSAAQIVEDFFVYNRNIGSKAYHRIKTSDNISLFRISIIEKLYNILNDPNLFDRALTGFIEIEHQGDGNDSAMPDQAVCRVLLREKITSIIQAFRNFDEIISEIDSKNEKYIASAVARAKFLLTNTNNTQGQISRILAFMADQFNRNDNFNKSNNINRNEGLGRSKDISLGDEPAFDIFNDIIKIFNIFPQSFIDNESLYVVPITAEYSKPEKLNMDLEVSDMERELKKRALKEKNKNRFSRKNINAFIDFFLGSSDSAMASQLPLENRRDLIRIIFISLYGRDKKSIYTISPQNQIINVQNFRFRDYLIERRIERQNKTERHQEKA
jgi:hypothetical protein